ncbi:MAG: hypothetical protein HUU03_05640 [Planctomycetaceae bacterium]|nr:hypothetical protein [Planctomycetota bacterium]NUO15906.1 hypothetical protein [Planctomycetaceae bacterium]HRJ77268.1 hypothetical protein [Planctomycetota bacterium]
MSKEAQPTPDWGPSDPEAALIEIRRKDPRYAADAYRFVFEGLDYTLRKYLKLETPRHVTGPELCEGMRRLALEQFGFMAYDVWTSWGIHCTRDLGQIIFNLVDARLLRATDEDKIEDFTDVFDLKEALVEGFSFNPPE